LDFESAERKQMIQRRFFSSCRDELPQLIRKRVQKLEEREEAFNKRMKKTSF
jgi:hypothetical protein